MEGAVKPGFLARFLSRFVDQKDIPFGGAAPMANPLSIESTARGNRLSTHYFAAVMGGVGKMLGQKVGSTCWPERTQVKSMTFWEVYRLTITTS